MAGSVLGAQIWSIFLRPRWSSSRNERLSLCFRKTAISRSAKVVFEKLCVLLFQFSFLLRLNHRSAGDILESPLSPSSAYPITDPTMPAVLLQFVYNANFDNPPTWKRRIWWRKGSKKFLSYQAHSLTANWQLQTHYANLSGCCW